MTKETETTETTDKTPNGTQQQPVPLPTTPSPPGYDRRPTANWRFIIWAVLGTVALILLWAYGQAFFLGSSDGEGDLAQEDTPRFVVPLSPTPSVTPSTTPTPAESQNLSFTVATETPTPVSGGRAIALEPSSVGWLAGGEPVILAEHLGDSFLYAGTLAGRSHYGLIQFDLTAIPRGSDIEAASLRLVGLRAERLAPSGDGQWQIQLLDTEYDYRWLDLDVTQLEQAAVWETLATFSQSDLAAERINQIDFSPAQIDLLEQRRLESDKLSLRLVGPTGETDNIFIWDSGTGPATEGNGPVLFLNVGPPPPETPPPHVVVITSTPTPENVVTAVAISFEMTTEATREGTATSLPPYWITPQIVTATPTAENEATAQVMDVLATAAAITTGEPPNREVVTLTPTPTYVIITSTPTPEDVLTAVAVSQQTTAEAMRLGTATPYPENWVTPAVVTSTPTPLNTATAEYQQALVLTTGTPTPLPGNAQTATPTPVLLAASLLASPTPTGTPTATPQPIPALLQGKIIFLSDREGATEEERIRAAERQATPQVTPQPYVYDPATGDLSRLTAHWPYDVARSQEPWSADYRYEVYNLQLLWTNVVDSEGNRRATEELAIHIYDHQYDTEKIITRMGAGIVYDPVFSPVSDEIAFVATESGNDEIWLVRQDGSDLRQLTRNVWEWDKHPSWSPDGQQIVFFSNRTGNSQLWIMNKDGSQQQLLLEWTPHNDFNPVWVKRLEPPPFQERLPDWRFVKPPAEGQQAE